MRLGREPLAALGAAAPQHVPAGARTHARTEPVRPGALALLGLIGALHRNRESARAKVGCGPRAEGTRRRSKRRTEALLPFSREMRGSLPRVPRGARAPLYPRLAEGSGGLESAVPLSSKQSSGQGPQEGLDTLCPPKSISSGTTSATSSGATRPTSSSTSGSIRSSSPRSTGKTLYVRAPDHIRTSVAERYLPLLRRAAAWRFDPHAVVEVVGADWSGPSQSDAPRAHAQPVTRASA